MTLLWSCNLFLGWWIVQVLFAASIWIIAKFNEQLLMGAWNRQVRRYTAVAFRCSEPGSRLAVEMNAL